MLRLLLLFCALAFALALPAHANKPGKDAEKAWDQGSKTYKAGDMVATRGHFRIACEGGHARACFNLGVMLRDGIGGGTDLADARWRFSRACAFGSAAGCYSYGNMAMEAQGGERNDRDAREAHERACSEGLNQACNSLAILIEAGRGGNADPARARELYQTACNAGEKSACGNLAKQATGTALAPPPASTLNQADYRMGLDYFTRRLYPNAYQMLRPFADSGDTTAQYAVGFMHAYGEGAGRDYLEAARFLVPAMRKGDSRAKELLDLIGPNIQQAEFVYMIDTQGPDMTSLQTFGYDVAVYCQFRGPNCSTWRSRYNQAERANNQRAFAEQMARAWQQGNSTSRYGNGPRRGDETFDACIRRQARTRGVSAGSTVLDFDCY
jgi:TPR repeat protein